MPGRPLRFSGQEIPHNAESKFAILPIVTWAPARRLLGSSSRREGSLAENRVGTRKRAWKEKEKERNLQNKLQ
ncbi:hypothetical protein QG37_00022 [Candidozyma auris]|uniref:Uncharacterized protein n=1 Tax=Candidozyma auris TaxID=498019 RepID=A0A0L0P8W1_CANAR|nr:hypothetical protein QG37_00022 [[Candida] auris]